MIIKVKRLVFCENFMSTEMSRNAVTGDRICTKYWLTAFVALAEEQCG